MRNEGQDSRPVLEAYSRHFQLSEHLDRMALAIFTILFLLVMSLSIYLHILGGAEEWLERASVALIMMALAAGGVHLMVRNATEYWITSIVIGQMTRGLGLVQRGLYPSSLVEQPTRGFGNFLYRTIRSLRGPFIIVFLMLGWYSALELFYNFMNISLATALAFLPPLILASASFLFSYGRTRYQLFALIRHEALAGAGRDELVANHCDLAEALLRLDPPRLYHAQKQYELALEIEPDNPRAKEGLQRTSAWKASIWGKAKPD